MNLKQALTDNKSIRLGLSAATWQEAVKLAVEPLIESGAVQPQYYDAIVSRQKNMDPITFSCRAWRCLMPDQRLGLIATPSP